MGRGMVMERTKEALASDLADALDELSEKLRDNEEDVDTILSQLQIVLNTAQQAVEIMALLNREG